MRYRSRRRVGLQLQTLLQRPRGRLGTRRGSGAPSRLLRQEPGRMGLEQEMAEEVQL